jgi:hypothetical protein
MSVKEYFPQLKPNYYWGAAKIYCGRSLKELVTSKKVLSGVRRK